MCYHSSGTVGVQADIIFDLWPSGTMVGRFGLFVGG